MRGYRGLREKLKTCNLLACHCGKRARKSVLTSHVPATTTSGVKIYSVQTNFLLTPPLPNISNSDNLPVKCAAPLLAAKVFISIPDSAVHINAHLTSLKLVKILLLAKRNHSLIYAINTLGFFTRVRRVLFWKLTMTMAITLPRKRRALLRLLLHVATTKEYTRRRRRQRR